MKNGQVTLVEVHPGMAADRSGEVFVGDVLTQIDQTPVAGLSIKQIYALIIAIEGETVRLTLDSTSRQMAAQQQTIANANRPTVSMTPGGTVLGSAISANATPSGTIRGMPTSNARPSPTIRLNPFRRRKAVKDHQTTIRCEC